MDRLSPGNRITRTVAAALSYAAVSVLIAGAALALARQLAGSPPVELARLTFAGLLVSFRAGQAEVALIAFCSLSILLWMVSGHAALRDAGGAAYGALLAATVGIAGLVTSTTVAAGIVSLLLIAAGLLIPIVTGGRRSPGAGGRSKWDLEYPLPRFVAPAAGAAAMIALHRLLAEVPLAAASVLMWLGAIAYATLSLAAVLRPGSVRLRRLATAGQLGVVATVIGIARLDGLSNSYLFTVAGALTVNHLLASGALEWTSDIGAREGRSGAFRTGAVVLLSMALVGLPPFPGFWARWQLASTLLATGREPLLAVVSLGSVLEIVRVLGAAARAFATRRTVLTGRATARAAGSSGSLAGHATSIAVAVILGAALGLFTGWTLGMNDRLAVAPFVFAAAVMIVGPLPGVVRRIVSILAIGAYAVLLIPLVSGVALLFAFLFAGAGVVAVGLTAADRALPRGSLALLVLTVTGFSGLVAASEPVTFLILWSYGISGLAFLAAVVRAGGTVPGDGIRPETGAAGIRIPVAAAASVTLVMVGLLLALQGTVVATGRAVVPELVGADGYVRLPALIGGWSPFMDVSTDSQGVAARVFGIPVDSPGSWAGNLRDGARAAILSVLAAGFLTAAFGALAPRRGSPQGPGIPIPAGATPDSPVVGIARHLAGLAGVFGVAVSLVMVGSSSPAGAGVTQRLIAWAGTAAGLVGALAALRHRDIRWVTRWLLCGSAGHVVLALATATATGWAAALSLSVVWILTAGFVQSLVPVAAGANSPSSARVRVLNAVALAALAGVPPLSGFGARWLVGEALLEAGWHLHLAVTTGSGVIGVVAIARTVWPAATRPLAKTGPRSSVAVRVAAIATGLALILISMYPNLIIDPAAASGRTLFPGESIRETIAARTLDYWSGSVVMYGVAAAAAAGLLLSRRARHGLAALLRRVARPSLGRRQGRGEHGE